MKNPTLAFAKKPAGQAVLGRKDGAAGIMKYAGEAAMLLRGWPDRLAGRINVATRFFGA